MEFWAKTKESFLQLARNPSLYGVLVAEYVLASLLVILFALIDMKIIGALFLGALDTGIPTGQTAAATAVLIALIVVQALILLLVDSFFKGGAYGMMRNLFQDGSTTIREFLPNAKRYWRRMLVLLFTRYALLLLLALPLIGLGIAGARAPAALIAGTLLLLIGWAAVLLLLLYGEALIMFEDAGALDAIARSARLALHHRSTTVVVGVIGLLMMAAVSLIEFVAAFPIDQQLAQAPSPGLIAARDAIGLVFNLVLLAIVAAVSLLVFHAYRDIAPKVGKRK